MIALQTSDKETIDYTGHKYLEAEVIDDQVTFFEFRIIFASHHHSFLVSVFSAVTTLATKIYLLFLLQNKSINRLIINKCSV